jgi:hypothetical protein
VKVSLPFGAKFCLHLTVQEAAKEETSAKQVAFITCPACSMLAYCLAYFSTLSVVTVFSETSADFQHTIRRYIPDDRILQIDK